MEVISYVYDLTVVVGEARGNPEAVRQLVEGTVNRQAEESRVEMAPEKTEWLMSTGGGKKAVKWLGVDVNRRADPSSHWNKRVAKAWSVFRSVGSLGNLNKGLSPRS